VVEVEPAQEQLVALTGPAVLGDDHAGHALEQLPHPQQRPHLEVLLADLATGGGVGHPDEAVGAALHDDAGGLRRRSLQDEPGQGATRAGRAERGGQEGGPIPALPLRSTRGRHGGHGDAAFAGGL